MSDDPVIRAALALCPHTEHRPECARCDERRTAITGHLGKLALRALGIEGDDVIVYDGYVSDVERLILARQGVVVVSSKEAAHE